MSRKAKIGRPKLPKGQAKGKIVPVRFTADDLKTMEAAARANKRTISEWIRDTLLQLRMTVEHEGYVIEIATRDDAQGGFTTSGWITKQRGLDSQPISFATTDRHPTKEAALESGIAFGKGLINGK